MSARILVLDEEKRKGRRTATGRHGSEKEQVEVGVGTGRGQPGHGEGLGDDATEIRGIDEEATRAPRDSVCILGRRP